MSARTESIVALRTSSIESAWPFSFALAAILAPTCASAAGQLPSSAEIS